MVGSAHDIIGSGGTLSVGCPPAFRLVQVSVKGPQATNGQINLPRLQS
jgi:hypothetical protein